MPEPTPELRARARRIRLVACDMDGTLLDSSKRIRQATLDAVRAVQARGIPVTLASGRIYTMLPVYSRLLDIRVPLITSNGAIVIHPETGETALDTRLEPEAAAAVVRLAMEHTLDLSILAPELCLFTATSLRYQNFLGYNRQAAELGLEPMPLEQVGPELGVDELLARVAQLRLSKFLVYRPSVQALAALEVLVASQPSLLLTQSDHGLYEVLPAGTSKGVALAALARHMGLDLDEVMAFGDFDNDRDLLETAGFPVAMANGTEEIRALADFVTRSNDEDGVAWALQRLLLDD